MTTFQSFSRETRFGEFCRAVKHCRLCTRLSEKDPILSEANGDPSAKVMFVAEAPGRLGADDTGIPLFGDQTGRNFEALLGEIGWSRDEVFLTNAVLCNPLDENGNNSTPTSAEIANCKAYLEMTLEVVDPDVVVTLGAVALEALANLRAHNYVLNQHVGRPLPWNGRIVVPMYHPASRARVHRPLEEQISDFRNLAAVVHPQEGIVDKRYRELCCQAVDNLDESFHRFQRVTHAVVESLGRVTYFKLTKLLYLIDLNALRRLGRTLTGEIYLRQEEGPWPPALRKMIEPLEGREILISFRGRTPMVEPGPSPRIRMEFTSDELEVIEEALRRYGELNNAGIKMAAYRTRPMRFVREQEKQGRDMRNTPVIYKDRALPELVG